MFIRKILSQNRRDFEAIYQCEHCGYQETGGGYDDRNYHENVIPKRPCKSCGKIAGESYKPLSPKYPDGVQI